MGVFTNINAALNTRLSTLSGLPEISWPNKRYSPLQGVAWIRPTLLPVPSSLSSLDGVQEHGGIYQIDIFVPLEKGIALFNTIADNLLAHFSSNKRLAAGTDVIFIQAVSIGQAVRQEAWYAGYVQINYLCYS